MIGTDLAKDLGVTIGDKVRLSTPTSSGDAYQIRGIYDLGQRNLNRAYAYVACPPPRRCSICREAYPASSWPPKTCSARRRSPHVCRRGCRTRLKAG